MNQKLDKYTTVKIGGIAKRILVPENVDELIRLIKEENPKYFIGGGSNLLISEREYDVVVELRHFNTSFDYNDNGVFTVGASVRLQQLINRINEYGYGGIEYLYSVPGLVGGAVAMNAGRGKKYNQTISDYILSVEVIKEGTPVILTKDECSFAHRHSIFKESKDIITKCTFRFPKMDYDESAKRKKERIELCKQLQDTSKPNFGSVFSECNSSIMNYAKKHKIGSNVHFSGKTNNWIINEGGSYDEAIDAIKKVEFLHKLFLKKCKREVIVWE